MTANLNPLFPITPIAATAQVTTANTALDGSGSPTTLYTPGSNGGRIEYIRVKATVTTTSGMIRLFIYTGSTSFLWKEISVTAATPSGTVQAFEAEFIPTKPLVLPSGYILKVTTNNSETFNVYAHGGDY